LHESHKNAKNKEVSRDLPSF